MAVCRYDALCFSIIFNYFLNDGPPSSLMHASHGLQSRFPLHCRRCRGFSFVSPAFLLLYSNFPISLTFLALRIYDYKSDSYKFNRN